ncbi:MAG: nitrate reductase associated protein [Janthinobacterium lividum]
MSAAASLPIFEFERRLVGDLELIPLCVRFHLDAAGVRISLDDWQRLPYAVRVQLTALPVDASMPSAAAAPTPVPTSTNTDGTAAAAALSLQQVLSRAGLVARHDAPEADWMPASDRLPPTVDAQCAWAGVPPLPVTAWAALTPFQRYALAKISRRDKPNVDFLPALREFGVI